MTIDLDFILYLCGAIASISAAVAVAAKFLKRALNKIISEEIRGFSDNYERQLDAKLSSIRKDLDEYKKSDRKDAETIRTALMSLTRERINEAHVYCMSKGYLGSHTRFVIDELYNSYKVLGGNSFVDAQISDIRSLPVISAEDKMRKIDKESRDKQEEI